MNIVSAIRRNTLVFGVPRDNMSGYKGRPKIRFPFYVKMTAGPAIGSIFEYERDQVQVID